VKRLPTIAAEIRVADAAYDRAVTRAARRLTRDHVRPFCDKHGLDFVAGMGSWSFHREGDHDAQINHNDSYGNMPTLPKRLEALLSIEVYGGQSLGSVAPDYRTGGKRVQS
jgi:hypothetical protein